MAANGKEHEENGEGKRSGGGVLRSLSCSWGSPGQVQRVQTSQVSWDFFFFGLWHLIVIFSLYLTTIC